jgi:hypothetical protein
MREKLANKPPSSQKHFVPSSKTSFRFKKGTAFKKKTHMVIQ